MRGMLSDADSEPTHGTRSEESSETMMTRSAVGPEAMDCVLSDVSSESKSGLPRDVFSNVVAGVLAP